MDDTCNYTLAKETIPFSVDQGVTSLITQIKVYMGLPMDATADIDLVLQNAGSQAVITSCFRFPQPAAALSGEMGLSPGRWVLRL